MTDSFVTQCPHCRTSFRVSRAQLGAAHGAVRCGACLHVFNAAQHLLGEAPPPQPSAPLAASGSPRPAPAPANIAPPPAKPEPKPAASSAPAQATPPGKQPSKTLWIHDDLDLDSIDLDEALAKLEEQEQQLSQEFIALERAPLPAENLLRSPTPSKDYDEEWAERLLNNDNAGLPTERTEPRLTGVSASTEQPLATTQAANIAPTPSSPPPATPITAAPEPLSASRREPSLTLDEPDEEDELPAEHLHADRDDAPQPNAGQAEEDLESEADEIEAIEEISDAQYRSKRSEPSLRNENLLHLEQEPLQLDWQKTKKPWSRKLAWLSLNLLGVLALGSQYINYHFEELARQDQYRPWFEQLCPRLGCKLPSKVEISLIKSSNLVVRSHPEFAGALVVDAILYNRAPFSQPFPLLELRFADLNGQLLASRRFKPSEYLSGELAGQAEMPPQTPIHISLDILDPGTKAVNYSLSFHSPE